MREHSLPILRAIQVCDEVLEDPTSGKVNLLGVFNSIRLPTPPHFPHVLKRLCVFVQMSDAEGVVPVKVEVIRARDRQVILRGATHGVRFTDKLAVVRVCIRILNCPFPEPGVYWIALDCNDVFAADQILTVSIA